ncbi:MAG: PilN domain-containing protein [Pseudomonadota bacterium]
MTEQTCGVVLERKSRSLGAWLTYGRALLSQSAADFATADVMPPERSQFFIEIGKGTPKLCALNDKDTTILDDAALKILGEFVENGRIDLVLSDVCCIDFSFEVPPGLLPEVSAMIESEILYRSPFAENETLAVWEAHEIDGAGWQVSAALTLGTPIKELADKLKEHNIRIASVIRERENGVLRSLPSWEKRKFNAKLPPIAILKSLSKTMQAAIAGAMVFALSATLFWGHVTMRDWSLSAEAERAQTELRRTAAASARLRKLDQSLSMSTEVLALTGVLTEALPDGVWLDQIILVGTDVTLVGFAPSAAEVTRILTDLPSLEDIKFSSPVVRDNSQSIERFRIGAILKGAAGQ